MVGLEIQEHKYLSSSLTGDQSSQREYDFPHYTLRTPLRGRLHTVHPLSQRFLQFAIIFLII